MALFKKKLNNALADILPKVIPQWFQGAFQHFLTMTRKPEQQVLNRLAHLRCLQRWLSGAPHCRSLPATGPDLPSPGDLPDSGIEPTSPALQAGSLPLSHQGSPKILTHVSTVVVLEKALESPLDYKQIKPVHPKGNQP